MGWLSTFATTTPTIPSVMDDFTTRLSLLHIGSKADERSWHGKLGSPGFTLAFLLDFPFLSEVRETSPRVLGMLMLTGLDGFIFFGFCLLMRAHTEVDEAMKEQKAHEAVHQAFRDAYCAIISNPDEDNKFICLRRFIIVLCEDGATKVLCDGKLPFIGMTEKVEQELFLKAYRNNWRKAASYIYRYSTRLRNEVDVDDSKKVFCSTQGRLEGLSAAINALQLVCHSSAWIESKYDDSFTTEQGLPSKRSRNVSSEKWNQKLSNLVSVLISEDFFDMAFTVILKFWKGRITSGRKVNSSFLTNQIKELGTGKRLNSIWLKEGKCLGGMTGQQPDPATLFRLYIDYGRLAEATNLILEYLNHSQLSDQLMQSTERRCLQSGSLTLQLSASGVSLKSVELQVTCWNNVISLKGFSGSIAASHKAGKGGFRGCRCLCS
ncbi:hypothetical protein HPP92_015361 [Vanilla planifolia]|uniref:NUP160 middle TPR domain-containing protein n=1 Tax=Vanilla planifolia TaxID=51239 RepID=A0A835QPC7_VANPL|nr:hypothetical protein HPP92_015361 [Vanilla planifolia]